mmetsp:Transcript_35529/g.65267  ORF Transcript_35529/g.65267 Transcript_35529/m.65267 type:complete len:281 (+) Transcript_35529:775-1617(+)
MFKTVHFSMAFLLVQAPLALACHKNSDCTTGWCEGGYWLASGTCKPKRNDGENVWYNENVYYGGFFDYNSCKSGDGKCGVCGWKMSNGKACSANSDCWSGRCDGDGVKCMGTCIEHDYIFNPSSNLVTYHDYNSCGPRGDDAQADLGQCQYGYRVVGAEKNDNYAVKARVNGCDYFAYTAYECLTTEDWSDTLSDGLCYNFRNRATGRILDAYTSGDVHAHAFNGGNYQKWYAEMSGNNYMFKNKATGRYLDSNTAGDVYTGVYNGGKYQEWVVSVTPCS